MVGLCLEYGLRVVDLCLEYGLGVAISCLEYGLGVVGLYLRDRGWKGGVNPDCLSLALDDVPSTSLLLPKLLDLVSLY